MSKSWTRQQKLMFVQECVKYDCLLGNNTNETKDRKYLRSEALDALSRCMNIPGFGPKEAYNKLRNVRSTYLQELKKIKNAASNGTCYVSKLIWFKTLEKALKAIKDDNKIKIEVYPYDENSTEEIDASTSQDESHQIKQESRDDELPIEVYDIQAQTDNVNITEKCIVKDKERHNVKDPFYEYVNVNCETNIQSDKCEGVGNETAMARNEFDVFGESISAQLRNIPLVDALEAQMYIQNYLSNLRLQILRRENTYEMPNVSAL